MFTQLHHPEIRQRDDHELQRQRPPCAIDDMPVLQVGIRDEDELLQTLPPAPQPLGFFHQRLAGLDHGRHAFRQGVAFTFLSLPVRLFDFVDLDLLDLLPSLPGGAIGTARAVR
jgi:hypothetical protein